MAIKSCKECGAQISSSAKSCPQCGISSPVGGLSSTATWALILITLCVVVATFGEKNRAQQAKAPAIEITAIQLYDDYQKNEVAADQRYKNRVVTVGGKIVDIRKSLGDPVVNLATGPFSMQVMVSFNGGGHDNFVAGLNRGEQLTITGICTGMTLGMVGISVR